ncbi:hypothetical protein BCR35DRAFT_201549 [Leucosporidium creatinivorum]|uniref:Uncharacterized protein n=1 Tax=Leucosporidium creatinivorum TaxID=106004 RepID=A0A1Y2DIH0_9BASI|nr:hypothetical protein BCR35DRAFT_201549 [Leucosporidium creatinivorum]
MPITEQEAIAWIGSATADSLIPLPVGRLPYHIIRQMVDFSTEVVHCIMPGGPTPPLFSSMLRHPEFVGWCQKVLERDERKRTNEATRLYGNGGLSQDDSFRRTFGHESDLTPMASAMPFLRIMFDWEFNRVTHAYVAEAKRIMMSYGSSRTGFIPLLWAGHRDWETSSAWTRGKVSGASCPVEL